MRMHVVLAVVGFSLGLSAPAAADPAYNAADIVSLFAAEAETGATRGICIGTEAECGGATAEVTSSPTFDLLVTFGLDSDDYAAGAAAPRRIRQGAARPTAERGDLRRGRPYRRERDGPIQHDALAAPRGVRRELLARKGRRFGQLVPKGYGEAQPKAGDPLDPENRRVETRIVVQ